MIKQEEVYRIGRIGKPHGVKGEVSLQFDDDVFDRVEADYLVLSIDGILVPFFIEEYRFRNNSLALMKFEGIDTQENAHELTGCEVFFPRHLSDSDEEHVSWAEIIGYQLVDSRTQKAVGEITEVDDSTLNILFCVCTTDGSELLVPASEELISNIDTQRRQIEMTLPEGLLELS